MTAQKKRAFAVAAHPDDIEFVMAGTLMLLGDAGFEIHYMNIANGCCGSTTHDATDTARIRQREALTAAGSIGAAFHPSLVNDMEIFYDHATLARLAAVMREVAPEIVLTHAPVDYMEDHMNACRLAVTAAFARGMPNYPTQPPRAPTEQAVTVYHAQPSGNRDPLNQLVRPGLFVDVGSVMAKKIAMLSCHESQQRWLATSQGVNSYLDAMRDSMRAVGRMSGRFEYAEGWRRHNHLGLCAAAADPLANALAKHVLLAS
jgi:LmbE family N-acetylglucosaminyl deacetylase